MKVHLVSSSRFVKILPKISLMNHWSVPWCQSVLNSSSTAAQKLGWLCSYACLFELPWFLFYFEASDSYKIRIILLYLLSHHRSLALACVREFIKKEAQALVIHTIGILQVVVLYSIKVFSYKDFNLYFCNKSFQGLMHLAAGDDAEIRAKVCCVFTKLIDTRMDLLVPHMEDIIEVYLTKHNKHMCVFNF